jgi:ribosomal protein S18 acetylase RimI-like enzyme
MPIREITKSDFQQFWPVFKEILQAQETYALAPDMDLDQAYALWCLTPTKSYVYEEAGKIFGTYYIKPNAMGPGSHVCNCGYMVSPEARGRGIARKMCEHSQQIALQLGFKAMQFNAVVSTNVAAIALWKKLGFTILGTVPKAYHHRTAGYVDTCIMYKSLQD